jgi:hypothetical protein
MPRFLLLLCGDESDRVAPDSPDFAEMATAFRDFTTRLSEAGALLDSAPLMPSSLARTARLRPDARPFVVDGPFAETKEVVGGYFLIETASLDEAVDWATSLRVVRPGSIEVRPLLDLHAAVDSEASRSSSDDSIDKEEP